MPYSRAVKLRALLCPVMTQRPFCRWTCLERPNSMGFLIIGREGKEMTYFHNCCRTRPLHFPCKITAQALPSRLYEQGTVPVLVNSVTSTSKINSCPDTIKLYLFNRTTCFDLSEVILRITLRKKYTTYIHTFSPFYDLNNC